MLGRGLGKYLFKSCFTKHQPPWPQGALWVLPRVASIPINSIPRSSQKPWGNSVDNVATYTLPKRKTTTPSKRQLSWSSLDWALDSLCASLLLQAVRFFSMDFASNLPQLISASVSTPDHSCSAARRPWIAHSAVNAAKQKTWIRDLRRSCPCRCPRHAEGVGCQGQNPRALLSSYTIIKLLQFLLFFHPEDMFPSGNEWKFLT